METEVMNYRLTTLQDLCSSGGNSESVEQLIGGDVSRGLSWLIGRRSLPKNSKKEAKASTSCSNDVDELEKQLQVKMEERVYQKVNEKLASLIKKLADANPTLKIYLDDCEIESENDNV